jgi:hypothetical protein
MKDTKTEILIPGPPKLKYYTSEDCDGKITKMKNTKFFETLCINFGLRTNSKLLARVKEINAKGRLCAVVAEESRSNFACTSRTAPRCTTSLFHYIVTRHGSNTAAGCISLLHHKKTFYVVTHSFRNKQLFWRPGKCFVPHHSDKVQLEPVTIKKP